MMYVLKFKVTEWGFQISVVAKIGDVRRTTFEAYCELTDRPGVIVNRIFFPITSQ